MGISLYLVWRKKKVPIVFWVQLVLNAFWSIMSMLYGFNHELDYRGRKEMLMENGVAVWDVLQSCKRLGSLDANIKQSTIVTNDFACFFF